MSTWFRSRRSSTRISGHTKPRRYRPAFDELEAREVPATGFLLSGLSSTVAGVEGKVTLTAINADGSWDSAYTGTVHFASSDTKAALPADISVVNGTAQAMVTLETAGTQTLTATDLAHPSITGSLGAGQPGAGFTQAPSPGGGLIASSWLDPDGSDADMYAYDNFTLDSNQSITEVDWRGGYIYNAFYSHASNFTITIFDSILGGAQPLVTNPQLPETYLATYSVGGNAGETYAGTVNGAALYDYQFVLPKAFAAAAGHTYWIRIEASQVGYPDWGIAVGTGGNASHFQFSTGAARFSYGSGDEAFTLKTVALPGVIVTPASTSQLVLSQLPASAGAGQADQFAVAAQDPFGNLTPGYTGTVHFSSSDWQATLPADYYFSSSDNGRQTFSATFFSAGPQSLSAADLFNPAVMPGAADITISPAAAAALSISGFPTGAGVGVADPFTVSVIDAFGNVASNYTGTIHFSSGDPLAALPADYHFQASDSGVQNFSATFNTPGVQTLDVVDLANSAISGSFFTTGQAAVFNFDTGSPTLTAGMGIPLTQTAGAVSAHFSSPNSWLAGGFSIQSHNTTFFNLDQFSGNYLYPNSVYNPNLAISFTDPTGAFSQPLSRISFTFATADFQQTEIPTTVRLTAYLGSTIVGTASGHGAYTGQTMPQGTLTFDGAGQVFDRVLIEIPWAPLAASDMLLDNFQVSTPDAFGVVVNAPTAPSTPTLALGGNLFAYDGAAHAATAAALGVDGVSPVAGSFSFTYNGSTTPPTDAGVYNVVASFTSADPNYADATISGSLVIDPAAPTLSLSAGSYLYDTAAHAAGAVALGVDGVTPVAGTFSFTYNGSATAPTNAGVYTVVASFTSADPNYADASVTGGMTIAAATPTVSVTGGSFLFDAASHAASAVALGVDGVTPVAGSFSFTYNGSATAPTGAGVYSVVANFVSADSNYADASATGSLTIAPAAATIAVTGGSFLYDTAAHAASAVALGVDGATPVAGSFSFTYNGSSIAPINAGVYTVVATFASADPNYANGSGTGTLTITAAAPVITVTGGTFNYDGAAHAASAVALGAGSAPVAGSFFLTYNGAPQVPTAAGVYAVVGTFTSADPNYSNGSGTGSLVIVAVAPSIAAPQILAQPTAQTVVAGSIVTFTASVSGNPASSVQWQVSRNGGKSFANISGARNATLTFSASRNDDGNLYRAVFTSSAGKVTTIAALLTVQTKARVKASSEAIVAAFVAEQQQKVLFEERLELAREVYEAVSVALAKRA